MRPTTTTPRQRQQRSIDYALKALDRLHAAMEEEMLDAMSAAELDALAVDLSATIDRMAARGFDWD